MATITPSAIPDLVATTRVSEGRLRFQQIAQNLPFYEVFSRWFKRDKVMFSSGYKIQRTLMNKEYGAMRRCASQADAQGGQS